MLMIRLHREGKKNANTFRLVVTEKQNAAKGKFMEIVGFYNPALKTKKFEAERINYWISKGAQVSDTAHNLLVSEGIIKSPKKLVKIRKKPATTETKTASASTKTA